MLKKRIVSAALALTMLLSMASFAFADTTTADTTTTPVATEQAELTASQVKALKPKATAKSYSYSKIKVSWPDIEGLDGYQVYRASSKNGKYSKVYTTTKNSYINTGRTIGKTYYYKVRGYKVISSKKVYTKYSAITSAYARPGKVKINDVYTEAGSVGFIVVDYKPVTGATGYIAQINQKTESGKWTGWRSYSYNGSGQKNTFDYWKPASKTEKWLEITEDNSTYKFRVKAYRTVKGKKYYGLWSDAFTLKEKIGDAEVKEIIEKLCAYGESYAKKQNFNFECDPMWEYPHMSPNTSGYFVDGAWGGFSRYSRKADIIRGYKDNMERYIDAAIQGGGSVDYCVLYIEKLKPGEGYKYDVNSSKNTLYEAFLLY